MAAVEITTAASNEHLKDGTDIENDPLASIPMAPEDPMFGLSAAFRSDTSAHKVDLGVGAYRNENLEPFVLPVVKKVGACNDTKDLVTSIDSQ